MADNMFEKFVTDVTAYQEDVNAEKQQRLEEQVAAVEAEVANRLALEELNRQRLLSHEGHSPEDLWGPDAAEICEEFLEFAISASVGKRALLSSVYLRGEDPKETYLKYYSGIFKKQPVYGTRVVGTGWRSSGYPIAYNNPVGVHDNKESGSPEASSNIRDPEPDILLCQDGLIRLGTNPLEYIDLNGTLRMPTFVRWDYNHIITSKRVPDYSYPKNEGVYNIIYEHNFSILPTKLDPLDGLKIALQNHALNIRDIQINGPSSDINIRRR